jgi:hypothetical protein
MLNTFYLRTIITEPYMLQSGVVLLKYPSRRTTLPPSLITFKCLWRGILLELVSTAEGKAVRRLFWS